MQIHELNNFGGSLGSGAYLAVDDGTDTGKLSTQQLLAATEARIDNIIAGPAPSAEEIVDARLGADGVTYPSLGDAIRDQFTDVKSDLGVKSSLGRPTDLNTVTARGVYNLYNQTATNGYTNVPSTWPVGTGAILFVDTGNATGVTWQIFIDTVGNVSTRRYANSAWASWGSPNNGGNWIFIGDSYLDGYTPDGGVDSWGVKLASFMGLDSDKYVISAKGGAGFYTESDGVNFKTLLQGVTAFEKNSVTNIVVCGGYNDNTQTAANIYNAVTTFLTKAKELYPSALVSVGMVGYNSASPGIRNNLRYNSLYAYQEAVGNAPNARYLPLVEYALNNSLMSSDGIHPNANGQVQIAIAVKNALTGSAGLFYYKRLPQTIAITGTTSANGEIAIAGTVASQNVLSVRYTTGSGFALYRNDGYVVCFDGNMQPKANTSVSIEVTYM